MKLNEKIILCRKKCGLSQEALGDAVGVSRQAVSKWETGDALPEVTKLKALADIFGVTADYLLSDDDGDGAKAEKSDGGSTRSEPEHGTNFVHSGSGGVSDRFSIFLRSYGWIGGILLIILGAYRTVVGLIGIITVIGGVRAAGAGLSIALPGVLSVLLNLAVAAAMIVGGGYIIKKFKPKKN